MKKRIKQIFNDKLEAIEYELIGKLIDLKLHDIVLVDNFDEDLFKSFCTDNYTILKDDLDEQKLNMIHCGTTSKFRIDADKGLYGNVYYYDQYNNANNEEKKNMLFEEFLNTLGTDYDSLEEDYNNSEQLLYDNIIEYIGELEEIINQYSMIQAFKDLQIDYWNEFIHNNL